jgi:hypothetical protein
MTLGFRMKMDDKARSALVQLGKGVEEGGGGGRVVQFVRKTSVLV